jgi:hypothetical protein
LQKAAAATAGLKPVKAETRDQLRHTPHVEIVARFSR